MMLAVKDLFTRRTGVPFVCLETHPVFLAQHPYIYAVVQVQLYMTDDLYQAHASSLTALEPDPGWNIHIAESA